MAEKVKYKATNIETGEEHIGNVDELSAMLDALTSAIYRNATKKTHLGGVWKIEKVTFKKPSNQLKKISYKTLNDWDKVTEPFKMASERQANKMMEYRRCVICNKPFVAKVAQAICCGEECRKIRRKNTMREYNKSAHVLRNLKTEIAAAEAKKKRKQKSDLNNDVAAADAMGVSYGIYKAIVEYGMAVERKCAE